VTNLQHNPATYGFALVHQDRRTRMSAPPAGAFSASPQGTALPECATLRPDRPDENRECRVGLRICEMLGVKPVPPDRADDLMAKWSVARADRPRQQQRVPLSLPWNHTGELPCRRATKIGALGL
jgi:hypothetical protein